MQNAELTETTATAVHSESFLRKQESRTLFAVVHRRFLPPCEKAANCAKVAEKDPKLAALCALAAILLVAAGCVERKMTIRSVPTGAVVWLDGERLGEAPVTVRFEQYGGRDITLSKANYERHRELVEVKPPFYQRLGPDFFFEHIWPGTLVDHQTFTFQLRPLASLAPDEPVDTEGLERGEQDLRDKLERFKEQQAP